MSDVKTTAMTILQIQKALKARGFDPGPLDGIMGGLTRAAVKAFQKANHLAVDGNPGLVTQEALSKPKPEPTTRVTAVFSLSIGAITRPIDTLIWHCTATQVGQEFSRLAIKRMHLARGFADIAYHLLVHLDGRLEIGRAWNTVGAHVEGHNVGSLGFSYIGGVTSDGKTAIDSRTPAQIAEMDRITAETAAHFRLRRIAGHRDFSPDLNRNGLVEPREWIKVCPCFDASPVYRHHLIQL